jgi:hypothetical protein
MPAIKGRVGGGETPYGCRGSDTTREGGRVPSGRRRIYITYISNEVAMRPVKVYLRYRGIKRPFKNVNIGINRFLNVFKLYEQGIRTSSSPTRLAYLFIKWFYHRGGTRVLVLR